MDLGKIQLERKCNPCTATFAWRWRSFAVCSLVAAVIMQAYLAPYPWTASRCLETATIELRSCLFPLAE